MVSRFGLGNVLDTLPDQLPLGVRQRLSLAVAMVHAPELLILDEPTSGVDPIARDNFWQLMIDLARKDQVTIFISTHFMNEAERCDRISLMHAGKVLVSDAPAELVKKRGVGDAGSRPLSPTWKTRCADDEIKQRRPAAIAHFCQAAGGTKSKPSAQCAAAAFSVARAVQLHAPRDAGTAARPGTGDPGAARQHHLDVHHGLRHQYGRGRISASRCSIAIRPR